MTFSPTALFVCVVGSSPTGTGSSAYQSAFPSSDQSTGARAYCSADTNSLSSFRLPSFWIMATPFLVSIRRRR
jgi:hypothetical protein